MYLIKDMTHSSFRRSGECSAGNITPRWCLLFPSAGTETQRSQLERSGSEGAVHVSAA